MQRRAVTRLALEGRKSAIGKVRIPAREEVWRGECVGERGVRNRGGDIVHIKGVDGLCHLSDGIKVGKFVEIGLEARQPVKSSAWGAGLKEKK